MNAQHTLAALAIALTTLTTQAAPVTIDFDELASGVAVDATYAGLGVTFSNATTVNLSGMAGASNPMAIRSISSGFQPQPSNPISATFAFGVSTVSLRGLDIGRNGFVLTAYDALVGGSVLDTEQVFGPDVGFGSFFDLTVLGTDIRRVEFSQVRNIFDVISDGAAFDNFSFDRGNTVPEPGSMALAALALLAVGGSRRRKV